MTIYAYILLPKTKPVKPKKPLPPAGGQAGLF